MKIGILTFHWSDNYGAVLQCYALQEYLKSHGHEVKIVNYAPLKYSLFYSKLMLHPAQLKNLSIVRIQKQKHSLLEKFRKRFFNLTDRIYKYSSVDKIVGNYDVIISGSDQVLNASFLLYGEHGKTPVYYLPYSSSKRVGYAVSFGCTSYPSEALDYAASLINNFDYAGVRENTGLDVLNQLGYTGARTVVPDPTILYGNHLFDRLTLSPTRDKYYCVYMLRSNITISDHGEVVYMDDTKKPVSMEQWISTIKYSKGLITNSYHGMIMAILNHVPFAVILESGSISGMNDRFYTILRRLGLDDHIFNEYNDSVMLTLTNSIDWNDVDLRIKEYRNVGEQFLRDALSKK